MNEAYLDVLLATCQFIRDVDHFFLLAGVRHFLCDQFCPIHRLAYR